MMDKLAYGGRVTTWERCEEWYPYDSKFENYGLGWLSCSFYFEETRQMVLVPKGPPSLQDPRGLLILQPRDLALCYPPTVMRLWPCLPLQEAPCLSSSRLQGFHTSPWQPAEVA